MQKLEQEVAELQRELERTEAKTKKRLGKAEDKVEKVPTPVKKKAGKRAKYTELSDEQAEEIARALYDKMVKAFESDNKQNEAKKPALGKLILLDEVTRELRKQAIQEKFISGGYCSILGHWLEPLPDGTYPNINVTTEMLHCIGALQICPDELQDAANLGRIIKAYARGVTGNQQVQSMAKVIMDRWSRMVFNISTAYDNERGYNEEQYRKLKTKLSKFEDKNAQATTTIQSGRVGIMLPQRNAFDFVERPQAEMQDPAGTYG